jgi:hypothetical protein
LTQPLTEMSTRNIIHVLIVIKSGNLNLMAPSGPLQACNGIALPLPFALFKGLPRRLRTFGV